MRKVIITVIFVLSILQLSFPASGQKPKSQSKSGTMQSSKNNAKKRDKVKTIGKSRSQSQANDTSDYKIIPVLKLEDFAIPYLGSLLCTDPNGNIFFLTAEDWYENGDFDGLATPQLIVIESTPEYILGLSLFDFNEKGETTYPEEKDLFLIDEQSANFIQRHRETINSYLTAFGLPSLSSCYWIDKSESDKKQIFSIYADGFLPASDSTRASVRQVVKLYNGDSESANDICDYNIPERLDIACIFDDVCYCYLSLDEYKDFSAKLPIKPLYIVLKVEYDSYIGLSLNDYSKDSVKLDKKMELSLPDDSAVYYIRANKEKINDILKSLNLSALSSYYWMTKDSQGRQRTFMTGQDFGYGTLGNGVSKATHGTTAHIREVKRIKYK